MKAGRAGNDAETKTILAELMTTSFLEADDKLLQACKERSVDYSSSTGVAVLVASGVLTCGKDRK